MKQWPAGVNFCFEEVTEDNILRMQDIVIPNDTKEATKLGMIVFRDKQCFNTHLLTCPVTAVSVFCPDRQASPMALSLLEQQLSFQPPFQSSIQVNSTQPPLSKTSPFKKI